MEQGIALVDTNAVFIVNATLVGNVRHVYHIRAVVLHLDAVGGNNHLIYIAGLYELAGKD